MLEGQQRRSNSSWVGSSGVRGPRVEPSNGSLPLPGYGRLRECPTGAACTAWSIRKRQLGSLTKQAAVPRYLRGKCAARPNEVERSQQFQDTPNRKQWLGFAHLFRPTYPDFLHGAPPTPACAAFIKESRMKFANAIKIHRKSGVRLRERGAPVLFLAVLL